MSEIKKVQITQHRALANVQGSSINLQERTIDVVFATDVPVLTYDYQIGDYYEILSFEKGHIKLDRINSSAPVLDSHRRWGGLKDGLGVVVPGSVKVDSTKRQATATLRFSKREDVEPHWQDIVDGIVTKVSVGYDVSVYQREASTIESVNANDREEEIPTLVAIEWEPTEISMALIPADINSGVRSRTDDPNEKKHTVKIINSNTMTEKERIAAERKRSAKISEAVEKAGLPVSFARTLTENDEVTEDNVDTHVATEQTRVAGLKTNPTPAPTPTPAPAPTAIDQVREQEILAGERIRVSTIRTMARAAGMEETEIEEMVTKGHTVEQVRTKIVDNYIVNDPHRGSRGNVNPNKDEVDKRREAMSIAIELRANPEAESLYKPDEVNGVREYRNMSLLEMADESIISAGGKSRGLSKKDRAQAALGMTREATGMHSTSDFPIILGNTINRVMRREYELYPQTYKPFTTQTTAADFREKTSVQLSGLMDKFEEVLEGGEYKGTTMTEASEKYRVKKYGRKLAFTWEALINDDLGAFNKLAKMLANKAAITEADLIWGALLGNAGLGDLMGDNKNLFHDDHGNIASADNIDIASLAAARLLMRKQKGLEGDHLNLRPKFLLIGEDKELEAAQYVGAESGITNTVQSTINPSFNRSLETIVEPRIPGNTWFLAASPGLIDTIEYAYLEGHGGLFTEQRQGFDVDGLEIKARLVIGVKAIDWRGFVKNPGA